MNNALFLFKKVIKSKLFIISTAIIIVLITACLALNLRNQNDQTLATNAETQSNFDTQQIKQSAPDKSKANQENITLTQADRKMNRHIHKMAATQKWQRAYQAQINYNHWQLKAESNGKVIDRSVVNFLMSEVYRCQYLLKRNLPEQSRTSPTKGITFSIFVDHVISAVLIPLLLIFNLGLLYTKRYDNGVDKDRLVPITTGSGLFQNLFIGYAMALLLVIGTIGLSFLLSSFFSGVGNWHYPIAYFSPKMPFNIYVSQGSLIIPILILRILSTYFVVTFVYLIAVLTKQMLPTILISIIALIGTNLVTPYLRLLAKGGQFLPTSYFNGVNVVSGQLAHETRNIQFSYIHGIETLAIWMVVIIIVAYGILNMRQRYYNAPKKLS